MISLKTIFPVAVAVICTASALAQTPAELVTQAQRAYIGGDYETARAKFEAVLKADPNHGLAKNYLRLINAQAKKSKPNQAPKPLADLVLPHIDFKDASFSSVLTYLKTKAAELSQDKVKVNFVVQLGEGVADSKMVSLSLNNVPFTECLRYVGDLVDVSFTYEQYAIVVRPKGALIKAPTGTSTDEVLNEPN